MRKALDLLTILLLLLPGCAAVQDWHYSTTTRLRADHAWAECTKNPLRIVCPSHYGHGWKCGFFSVAMGGTGQAPTLPPKEYQSPKYQNPRGQKAISDWYAGFQDGVNTAEIRGVGQFHYLRSYGIPADCPNNSLGFPPAVVVPEAVSPAAATERLLEGPLEALPPADSGAAVEPPANEASWLASAPSADVRRPLR